MATIRTTTNANPIRYPGSRRIERQTKTGWLFHVAVTDAGTGLIIYRSTDNGTTWAQFGVTYSIPGGYTVLELGSMFIDWQDRIYLPYRVNVSSQDRIYLYAGKIYSDRVSPHSQLLVASASNGGVAGSWFTGMGVLSARHNDGRSTGFVAAGYQSGSSMGLVCYGFTIPAVGQPVLNNAVIANRRAWVFTEAAGGHQVPAVGHETPINAWITWGRTRLYAVKLSWTGAGWTGPTTAVKLTPGTATPPAVDSVAAVWRNPGWCVAQPHGDDPTRVAVSERNQANTRTVYWFTEPHPAGNVRHCAIAYDTVTRNLRVYAVGTSSAILYHCDFLTVSSTWTGWTQTVATAILGTNADNYNVHRYNVQSTRYDVLTAHAGSPNTVAHLSQTITFAPYAPDLVFGSTANSMAANGVAANVGAALDLVWRFRDPDPGDTQSAWALSRQIGTGTIQYLRASDGTWQATEQKNVGTATSRTLASGWGSGSDANHTYKVKVWDSTDTASVYSAALVVVPSAQVNPTITSPAVDGAVITEDTVTLEWSVAEQTAYRVRVRLVSDVLYDSDWRAGDDASFAIPFALQNNFSYSIDLFTRNAEGLQSAQVVRNITVDYIEPPEPTLAVTVLPDQGLIRVTITNPDPVAENTNTSFDTDLTGWATNNGGTASRVTGQVRTGPGAARVVPDGVGGNPTLNMMVSARLSGTPGETFTAWGWVYAESGASNDVAIYLHWYNGTTFVSSTMVAVDPTPGEWVELVIQDEMPPGANAVITGIGRRDTPLSLAAFGVDDLKLFRGAHPKVTHNILERRREGSLFDNSTLVVVADGVPVNGTFDDWTARSGYPYEYRALAVADNGTSVYSPWTP